MSGFIENKLTQEFENKASFTREELYAFYHKHEPELNHSTFGWRIHNLINKNKIKALKRGLYTVSHKPKYTPKLSEDILQLTNAISSKFENVKYCIWDTNWLNEFSPNKTQKNAIIIEVEKNYVEVFFNELKDIYKGNVFLSPDEKIINLYLPQCQQPLIIKRLVSRSPINKQKHTHINISTPCLEKILVDIYSDNKLFNYTQGSELALKFENTLKTYGINYTKLFSYACRREKENDLRLFLIGNLYPLIKDIINV